MDTNRIHIGIDIGSACTKAVVMDKGGIAYKLIMPTGWSSVDTAQSVKQNIEANMGMMENASITATGYGRISVPYAGKTVTEITCHAKGACYLYNAADLSVIDIGGQDTKIITIERGAVTDFMMNDKCSAGTGRFLEVMANTLALRPDELCSLAQRGGGVSISSMCTVFAESEVINLIGRGGDKGEHSLWRGGLDSEKGGLAMQPRKAHGKGGAYRRVMRIHNKSAFKRAGQKG